MTSAEGLSPYHSKTILRGETEHEFLGLGGKIREFPDGTVALGALFGRRDEPGGWGTDRPGCQVGAGGGCTRCTGYVVRRDKPVSGRAKRPRTRDCLDSIVGWTLMEVSPVVGFLKKRFGRAETGGSVLWQPWNGNRKTGAGDMDRLAFRDAS